MSTTGENIIKLRKSAKLTQKEFAEIVGVSYQLVSKWEKNETELKMHRAKNIAEKFNVTLADVLGIGQRVSQIPIEVYVGAGAEIFHDINNNPFGYEDVPPGESPDDIRAAIVRGESMYPAYRNGDILYYRQHQGSLSDLIGRECVVLLEDDRSYVKTIMKGSVKGKYTLTSHNAAPVPDVKIKWAAPVNWVKRSKV